MNFQNKTKQRLKFIEEYLRKGNKPTLSELIRIVSDNTGEIKERQLLNWLKILKEEGINGTPLQIVSGKDKRYSLQNNYRFHYSNLLQSERATLPLLFGLLKPYSEFPAVKSLLNNIIQIHKLDVDSVKMLSLAIGSNSNRQDMKTFERIIKCMNAIHEQVVVEFNYVKVREGAITSPKKNENYVILCPLQVRIHDGRYYLVGIQRGRDFVKRNLQSYAFDMIQRGPDPYYLSEEEEQPCRFDWNQAIVQSELENAYSHCFGMFCDFTTNEKPGHIYRWFKGWAASFVRAVPIHHSQEIIDERPDGSIRIRLHVYDTVDLQSYLTRFGDLCWED